MEDFPKLVWGNPLKASFCWLYLSPLCICSTIKEIHSFCTANFDIQFPQFDKIEVNGANEHPLYTYLKSQKGFGGFDTSDQRGKLMDDMLAVLSR